MNYCLKKERDPNNRTDRNVVSTDRLIHALYGYTLSQTAIITYGLVFKLFCSQKHFLLRCSLFSINSISLRTTHRRCIYYISRWLQRVFFYCVHICFFYVKTDVPYIWVNIMSEKKVLKCLVKILLTDFRGWSWLSNSFRYS